MESSQKDYDFIESRENVVTFETAQKMLPGATIYEIQKLTESDILPTFCDTIRKDIYGIQKHYLKICHPFWHDGSNFNDPYYETTDLVCRISDIQTILEKYPEYSEELVQIEDAFKGDVDNDFYISCEDIRKLWGWSPLQFRKKALYLGLPTDREEEFLDRPYGNDTREHFFSKYPLEELKVHISDLREWVEDFSFETHINLALPKQQNVIFDNYRKKIISNNENIKDKYIQLQKELQEKTAHIAELEAQIANLQAEAETPARTAAASIKKHAKALEEMQSAFPTMLLVAMECAKDASPKRRTKNQLAAMATRLGNGLTDTQMKFFRECLPKEYLHEGGAPSQG